MTGTALNATNPAMFYAVGHVIRSTIQRVLAKTKTILELGTALCVRLVYACELISDCRVVKAVTGTALSATYLAMYYAVGHVLRSTIQRVLVKMKTILELETVLCVRFVHAYE